MNRSSIRSAGKQIRILMIREEMDHQIHWSKVRPINQCPHMALYGPAWPHFPRMFSKATYVCLCSTHATSAQILCLLVYNQIETTENPIVSIIWTSRGCMAVWLFACKTVWPSLWDVPCSPDLLCEGQLKGKSVQIFVFYGVKWRPDKPDTSQELLDTDKGRIWSKNTSYA